MTGMILSNPPKAKVWTPETVQLLVRLWGEGLSAAKIAQQIPGATRNSIIGKRHRMGLDTHKQAPSLNPIRIRAKRERMNPMFKEQAPNIPEPNLEPPKGTIPFMKSNATTCRSVEGYADDGLALFCSNPKSFEASFCPYHQAIYYRSDVK